MAEGKNTKSIKRFKENINVKVIAKADIALIITAIAGLISILIVGN